jgi:hypothetical protein
MTDHVPDTRNPMPTDQPLALKSNLVLGPNAQLVARLRAESTGFDEWRVQDPKDGSYCMTFNHRETFHPERDAREWLADYRKRHPNGRHAHFEVACRRVLLERDHLMLAAADELERLHALAFCGCGDGFTTHDPGTCGACVAGLTCRPGA